MHLRTLLLILTLALSPLSSAVAEPPPLRIMVLGDSLLASNRVLGGSVAQALRETLGDSAEIDDRSTIGARFFYAVPGLAQAGLKIGAQVQKGDWDYVVMNGGGNDLLFGCGCGACTRMLNRLIASDGTAGAIPDLVAKRRATGAKVIFLGYLRTPGVISPVETCGPLGDEMDRRLTLMAALDDGITFLPLAGLVTTDGDRSFHAPDLVHPSLKGSRAIADLIAAQMTKDLTADLAPPP